MKDVIAGVSAMSSTSPSRQSRRSRLVRYVASPFTSAEVRKKLQELASTFYPAWTPAEVDAFYAAERTKWIPIVRQAIGKN